MKWKVITYGGHNPPNDGDWVGHIESEKGEKVYHGAFSTHAIRERSHAFLIAAAPEMLKACEIAQNFLNSIDTDPLLKSALEGYLNVAEFWEAFNQAKDYNQDAITKAKG